MALAATIDLLDAGPSTDRAAPRVAIGRPSTVRDHGGAPRDVLVEDLSQTGFRYCSAKHLAVGTAVRLGLAGAGTAAARVVRQDGDEHGCEFETPLTVAQLQSAFTSAGVTRVSPTDGDFRKPDRWPAGVRLAILLGFGAAAWAVAIALVKLLA